MRVEETLVFQYVETSLHPKEVSDEGSYWEKRDVRSLAEEVVRWNQQMAGLAGKMKDLLGGDVEAAIMKFQNFEHLEAEGRKDE